MSNISLAIFIVGFWIAIVGIFSFIGLPYDVGGESFTWSELSENNSINPFDYLSFFFSAVTFNIPDLWFGLRFFINFMQVLSVIMIAFFLRGSN